MANVKIQITSGTIVAGVGDARPGTVMSVDPGVARELFIAGKAVPAAEKVRPPTTRKKPGKAKPKTTKAKK